MQKVIELKTKERVQKLIALALNNPNVEEARTAALQALTLMRQHGMVPTTAELSQATIDRKVQEALAKRDAQWNRHVAQLTLAHHQMMSRLRYHLDRERNRKTPWFQRVFEFIFGRG